MKYKIDEKDNGLDIIVDDIEDKKEKLLSAFQECQEGRCSCPTEEYKKLDSLEIVANDTGIKLHLKTKHGLKINKDEINKCLKFTEDRVTESK